MKFFRSLKLGLGIALAAMALLAQPSIAAPIYLASPYDGALSGVGADVANTAYPETISLGKSVITSVSWWGFFGSQTASFAEAFVVSLNSAQQLGTLSKVTNDPITGLNFYTLSLTSAYQFLSGGDLTVELINNDDDVQWFWQDAKDGQGNLSEARALQIDGRLVATAVPEPGSLMLVLAAGCALILLSRRSAGTGLGRNLPAA